MFARIRQLFFNLTAVFIALVVLSSFLIASYELETWPFGDHRTVRQRYEFRRVSRTVLESNLRAPGRVESSRRTVIRCELERMATSSGATTQTAGASTMIWVIPEGTEVDEGDVIARLDASTYEEMLRQQTIVVEQAKASYLQAELDVEIAQIALREYLEGTVEETRQAMEANLRLARSNVTQAGQRLEWTMKMNKKGYASLATVETDKQTFMTNELALQQQEMSYDLFKRFTLPKNQMTLQADITTAKTTLDSETVKRNKQVERFELLKRQVNRCTIRAPHDGVVYYYVDPPNQRRGPMQEDNQIQEGMSVRQEQKLFFLPDLDEMEVQLVVNESVVNRVRPGLTAIVEFEAIPQLRIPGKLVSVSEIPNRENQRGEDVRFFMGILKLDRSAEGLKPGMSAIVTLTLPQTDDILVVPPAAVFSDQGRYSCYVAVADHLERRDVKVGRTTPEVMEITDGLTEGEEVVLDPPGDSTRRPKSLAGFEDRPWSKEDFSKADELPEIGPRNRRSYGGGQPRQGIGTPGDSTRKSRKRANADEG
jgi:HlyD family secretion protein